MARRAFLPDAAPERWAVVGAAAGTRDAGAGVSAGIAAGAEAAQATGFPAIRNGHVPPPRRAGGRPPLALFAVEPEDGEGWGGHYLDLQRDAVVADLRRAVGAGLRSPEHVKRFTTIGTASDQGRTSGVLTPRACWPGCSASGWRSCARRRTGRRPCPSPSRCWPAATAACSPTPCARRPSTPGTSRNGAVFEDVGQWKRPWYYPARRARTWTPPCCASAARRARPWR